MSCRFVRESDNNKARNVTPSVAGHTPPPEDSRKITNRADAVKSLLGTKYAQMRIKKPEPPNVSQHLASEEGDELSNSS